MLHTHEPKEDSTEKVNRRQNKEIKTQIMVFLILFEDQSFLKFKKAIFSSYEQKLLL
jgi:hypothetical protein